MNEEICCIISRGKTKNGYEWIGKWGLWHSLSFVEGIYIKLGQFFFHTSH